MGRGAAADGIGQVGGGRKRLTAQEPTVVQERERWVEPGTRGAPESRLLWTRKSTYHFSEAWQEQGQQISQRRVYNVLGESGYPRPANRKRDAGASPPDRHAQFEYSSQQVQGFLATRQPVISVDAQKKENLGNFKQPGQEYQPTGKAPQVRVYDFPDQARGQALPYGGYDLAKDQGWGSVGIRHDTAEFAVATMRAWWRQMGKPLDKPATELYITADGGGSNGSRVRLWKTARQRMATPLHLTIQVSPFPPGTRKWHKIEHRLCSFIAKNWRGRPLLDRVTVVNLMGNTNTKTGLTITARLDAKRYEKGRRVSDQALRRVNLHRDPFHGEWNYAIRPQAPRNREIINAC